MANLTDPAQFIPGPMYRGWVRLNREIPGTYPDYGEPVLVAADFELLGIYSRERRPEPHWSPEDIERYEGPIIWCRLPRIPHPSSSDLL